MKKRFSKGITMAMFGILLLGGCGSIQKEQLPQESVEIIQEPQTENETFERESSENENPDETVDITAGSSLPTIAITQEKKEWHTDDGAVLLLEADASKVEVIGDGFDALKDSLAGQWNGLHGNYDEELEWAKEQYDFDKNEEDSYFPNYSVSESVRLYRLDDSVISFCENDYQYTGGAHGSYGNQGRTFDVKSGKELQLEDILSDSEGFYDKALDYILDDLRKNYEETDLFPEYEEIVRTDTFGETPVSWYLDSTGIMIDYGLYMIAPYVTGVPSVLLPYDTFAAYIKEDYIPHGSLIVRVKENEDFSSLIGEDGKVLIESGWNDEYEMTIVSGSASEKVGTFSRLSDAYVIKREDGRSFVVFVCDYASDDFVTYVYEVTGGDVRECDKLDGAAFSSVSYGAPDRFCIGTDKIGLSMHLDVLGTYSGAMVYLLDQDGKLIQTEEIFAIVTSHDLTVIKDLPVVLEGADSTIPAGSKIKITGTDNEGTVYFQKDSGETGVIKYVRDDEQWQLLIGGVSENEYFEMLPYAG